MNSVLVLPAEQESVTLRQLTIEDAPVFFETIEANRGNGHLSAFVRTEAAFPDIQSVEAMIRRASGPEGFLLMGIFSGDTFVGSIDMAIKDEIPNIGYWLDARQTGKGYATTAVRTLVEYVLTDYPKVRAEVDEENASSVSVLERAGFVQSSRTAGRLIFELTNK